MTLRLLSLFVFLVVSKQPSSLLGSVQLEGLRNFSETGDGQWRIPVSGEEFEAKAALSDPLPAGQYVLKAQARTESFSPMGSFVVAITEGVNAPAKQVVAASSEWSDMAIMFEAVDGERPTIRIFDAKGNDAEATIEMKDIVVTPLDVKKSENLLINGDFAKGKTGAIPDAWHWRYHGQAGDYSIQPDKTFKTGQQVLEVLGSANESREICSTSILLPPDGQLALAVWARSDQPGQELTLWMIGDDFHWKARQTIKLTSDWKRYVVSAACPPSATDPSCYARFSVKGAGNTRLAGASMVWSAVAKQATSKDETAARGRNLLGNPGFALGMNDWMFDFFAPDSYAGAMSLAGSTQPEIVPNLGVNGTAAMRLSSRSNSLISSCLPLQEGAKYTLSAYVKAEKPDASLKMFLIDSGWKIYSREFARIGQDGWARVSMTITWDQPSKQKKIYARFDGDGILIDDIQLEQGDLTPYAAPQVEAGFLFQENNVFLRTEAQPSASLCVISSNKDDFLIRARIITRDAWGSEIQTSEESVKVSGGRGEIPVPLPGAALGVFEISAIVSDSQGAPLAKCQSRYAVIDAPAKAETDLPLFGINYEPLNTPLWLIKKEMPLWNLMGAKFSRFFLRNRMYTPEPPPAYIRLLQEQCSTQISSGFQALVACFNNIPEPIRDAILDKDTVDDATLQAYGRYLRDIVEPLKGQVRYWEIANEPNLWRKKEGVDKGMKTMPPAKYVQLLKVSHDVIKSVDPALQVVGICLNGNDYSYMEECLKQGAGRYMDIFSYHSYRESPDLPDVYNDLVAYRNLLEKYGFRGRLMNTEQYFASNKFLMHGSDDETRRNYYLPDDRELEACSRTIRNYIYHAAAGVPYCAYSPQLTFFRLGGYDRYYIFHAFAAYNAATRFLAHAGTAQPVEMGSAIRAFLFSSAEGGPLVTINATSPDVEGSMRLPRDIEAYDMMGNSLPAKDDGLIIPLSHVPVYLRFPGQRSEADIRKVLHDAEILGLGEAFALNVSLEDQDTLAVTVTNRLNKPVSGKLLLGEPPENWRYLQQEALFSDLGPGNTTKLKFEGSFEVRVGETYDVAVAATAGDGDFVKKEIRLAPMLVPRLEKLTVDGDLSEWSDVPWISLDSANLVLSTSGGDGNRGKDDLSVRAAFAWTPEYFACAFRVKDDVENPPESPAQAWTHDSIQIYFDQSGNNRNRTSGLDGDDMVYAISVVNGRPVAWIEKGAEGRYVGEANASTGIDRDVEIAVKREGDETIYEIKFPQTCFPALKLEKGSGFGFAFLVNDNDGKGRKPAMSLLPGGLEPAKNISLFRDLYLN